MSEQVKTQAKKVNEDDRVEIFVPRGTSNEDPNLLISVNGVNYLLPRGKKSMVPPHIAYEYERAKIAEEKQYETQIAMQDRAKNGN